MKKTYKVNDIFYSLQGEGFWTGTPAVFVRLSGCNLQCHFCDTDHFAGRLLSADEIVDAVKEFPATHVIITGGEPAMQLDAALVDALHRAGLYIHIETNGTFPLPDGIDWVTCSPKTSRLGIARADELKYVFQGRNMEDLFDIIPADHHFLQPCSGENIDETVAYVLEYPHWSLSLQTHKLIDIK